MSKNNRGGFSHFAASGEHGHGALYFPNNWNCISEEHNKTWAEYRELISLFKFNLYDCMCDK